MKGSIRLRWAGHFKRLFDQRVQLVSHRLRKTEIHAEPGTNAGLGGVPGVNDGLCQGQIDHAVEVPAFNEKAGHHGCNSIIDNDPVYIAYAKGLATPNHNLISHQNYPLRQNIELASFNQKSVGVESRQFRDRASGRAA